MSGKVARAPKHNTVLEKVRHGCEAPVFLDFDNGDTSASQISPSRQNILHIRPGVLQRQTGQCGENSPINKQLSCKALSLPKEPFPILHIEQVSNVTIKCMYLTRT